MIQKIRIKKIQKWLKINVSRQLVKLVLRSQDFFSLWIFHIQRLGNSFLDFYETPFLQQSIFNISIIIRREEKKASSPSSKCACVCTEMSNLMCLHFLSDINYGHLPFT